MRRVLVLAVAASWCFGLGWPALADDAMKSESGQTSEMKAENKTKKAHTKEQKKAHKEKKAKHAKPKGKSHKDAAKGKAADQRPVGDEMKSGPPAEPIPAPGPPASN